MNRPATYADFRRVVQEASGVRVTRPRVLPRRIGPPPPGFGPTVERVGRIEESSVVLIPPLQKESPEGRGLGESSTLDGLEGALKRAVLDALYEAPPLVIQSSAQEDPGAKGRSTVWTPPGGIVIVQGGSAGAIAAADALRLGVAHTTGASVLSLLSPIALGSAGAPTSIFTFYAPDDRALVARRFKLDASEPSAFVVIQFTVDVAGEQVLPLFNMKPNEWFPLNVAAKPGVSITLRAANLKSTAAYVLRPKIDGWTIPVATIDDSLDSKTYRNSRRNPL